MQFLSCAVDDRGGTDQSNTVRTIVSVGGIRFISSSEPRCYLRSFKNFNNEFKVIN